MGEQMTIRCRSFFFFDSCGVAVPINGPVIRARRLFKVPCVQLGGLHLISDFGSGFPHFRCRAQEPALENEVFQLQFQS